MRKNALKTQNIHQNMHFTFKYAKYTFSNRAHFKGKFCNG